MSSWADVAIVGGDCGMIIHSEVRQFPVADFFTIGDSSATEIATPMGVEFGIYGVAVSPSGTVLYVGMQSSGGQPPVAFVGSVGSATMTQLTLPNLPVEGQLTSVAFAPDESAVMVGADITNGHPLAYRWTPTLITSIDVSSAGIGEFTSVAIAPDGTALMAGAGGGFAPVICTLSPGASMAASIFPEGTASGEYFKIAVAPTSQAIACGNVGNSAAIASLLPPYQSATSLTVPVHDNLGQLYGLAMDGNGVAVAGGYDINYPVIYRIIGTNVIPIGIPENVAGGITCVAMGSDGTAILGGGFVAPDLPLIYRLGAGDSAATTVGLPNDTLGYFQSVGIGRANIAVLGGLDESDNTLCYTTPITPNATASVVNCPSTNTPAEINSVAVYPPIVWSLGLYDLYRLTPIYEAQLLETINVLHQAGIP